VSKSFVFFMALFAMTWFLFADQPTNTKKSKSSSSGKSRSSSKSRAVHPKPVRRSYQQAPTPDRYKEIQQALIDKGYFKGSADGKWGQDSVEALKQFQAEQNLEPDGKIGSLSIIALGLGHKHLTAQSTPQAAPAK